MGRQLDSEDYTIALICALPLEAAAATAIFDEKHDAPRLQGQPDDNAYVFGRISYYNVIVTTLPAGCYGTNSAAIVVARMCSSFRSIKSGLMVGIGGGVPIKADIRLGDIVVSQPGLGFGGVLQYDFGKTVPGGFFQTGSLNNPPQIFLSAVAELQRKYFEPRYDPVNEIITEILRKGSLRGEFRRPPPESDRLFRAEYSHPSKNSSCDECSPEEVVQRLPYSRSTDKSRIHYGLIASGNQVMKDAIARDNIAQEKDVLCFEMEAAGLMNQLPCLVIRGICDYCDSHKNKIWQHHAALAAAAFAKALLLQLPTPTVLNEDRQIQNDQKRKRRYSDSDNYKSARTKQINFTEIPSVRDAEFDSYADELDARCHPDTRTDLLRQIDQWAESSQGKCIFWLNGVAGTGKSTISRTVAQRFQDKSQLGASFFFKRGESERDNPSKFFTTIAIQLLRVIPDLVPHIRNAIDKEPEIATKSLDRQFESLIFQPLQKLHQISAPLVLVIDAFDECEDERIKQVLYLLARMRELTTAKIRIFLTSRPELPIRLGFDRLSPGTHEGIILQELPPDTIEHDISVFLRAEFHKIVLNSEEHSADYQISTDWPSEESIRKLTQLAKPLFIFAATLCRFIGDNLDWDPKERLANILNYGTTGEGSQLDRTYLPVFRQFELSRSKLQLKRFGQEFRKIVGSIVNLADPLSASSLAGLLGKSKEEINSKLGGLHSVLSVPSDSNLPIRPLHLSFREFLVDPDKENDDYWFWINEKETHAMIAARCLEVLFAGPNKESKNKRSIFEGLRENICSLEYPGMPRKELSNARICERLPKHAQYACRYWVYHLKHSGRRINDEDIIYEFLSTHFLHWLEALSILGRISDSIGFVDTLRSLVAENEGPKFLAFLHDARRFLLQSRWIIDQAPLQLYSSAIIFSPEQSIIRTIFQSRVVPQWICRLPKTPKSWGAELQQLEGHTSTVNCVAFSPDGRQLASGSSDETVRLWDAKTGQGVKVLRHKGPVLQVAFSFDNKYLAALSGNVLLWDVITGHQLKNLGGNSEYRRIYDFAFSPDSEYLATASGSVILWGVPTGCQLKTFGSEPDGVVLLAFSPNSKLLASVSGYGSIINIRNVETGKEVKTFSHDPRVERIAFSPDGNLLVLVSKDFHIWDVTTWRKVTTLGSDQRLQVSSITGCETMLGGIRSFELSPDGKQLAYSFWSISQGDIELLDLTSGLATKIKGNGFSIRAIAFSPDSEQLASASDDYTIKIWDAMAKPMGTVERHSLLGQSVVFSPDNKQLASSSEDGTINLWDAATGELFKTFEDRYAGSIKPQPHQLFFLNDRELLSISESGKITIWDIATGQKRKAFTHIHGIYGAILSPNGKHLALARRWSEQPNRLPTSTSGVIMEDIDVWDLETGEMRTFKGPAIDSRVLAFSPDSKELASGCSPVTLWNLLTGQETTWETGRPFTFPGRSFCAIVFSPDSKNLALAEYEKIQVWNLVTGSDVRTLYVRGEASALALSPNNRYLAFASNEQMVELWDLVTGERQKSIILQTAVRSLRFSEDAYGESLETDKGTLFIPPKFSAALKMSGTFLNGEWITQDGQDLLWLPHGYRSDFSVVRENLLVISGPSRTVTFLEINYQKGSDAIIES
ncbi:hypothetical protein TWF730_003656 [Orbilia blumenaviensis]|uniref:NACHT domain-containing protein n=1 Tax=Orbilia blumenaviensis TaxID=1796055 RepID=A0AAV9U762_9PEZI